MRGLVRAFVCLDVLGTALTSHAPVRLILTLHFRLESACVKTIEFLSIGIH